MPIMLYTFFILCLFGGATASYPNCATTEAHKNFDIKKYSGPWFVSAIYSSIPNSQKSSCGRTNFNIEWNGMFKHINSAAQGPNRIILTTTDTGYNSNLDEPARFRMKDDAYGVEYDEVVLDTDYESYAVTFKCPVTSESNVPLVSLLTRDQNPSSSTLGKMVGIVIKNNINQLSVTVMNHTDCEHVYWSRFGWAQASVNCH